MKIDKVYVFLMIVGAFVVFLWISSCRHDAIFPSNLRDVCFESEVLPIFLNSCATAGCHDGSGEAESYNNYVDISHAVISGNPNGSRIYKSIIKKSGENRMPPDKPLSLDNRMIIRIWIEQGAKLTLCSDTTQTPPAAFNSRTCFSRDILPVLVSSCGMTGCHDAISHQGDYIYASYSTIMNSVRPGNPGQSALYRVITTTSGENRMPPAPKSRLAQAQIDSIAAWIRRGALNEVCGEACDTINPVTFSGVIWPVIQTSCTGCHSGSTPSGSVSLTNYANIQAVAASGLLMNSLKGNGVTRMPPSGSLSSCKIRQFQIWISKGYLNN
jgi:cytochrome c5